ncbi:MAG: serine hydrolase [Gammaproteobacteria bacterium]
MKKLLIGLPLLGVLLFAGLSLVGVTPSYIVAAPGVASGIGSKLLCSARYVSGFDERQAFDDLVQYSPILEQLTIAYDESRRSVSTSIFGLSEQTARFIPGLGCAVDYPSHSARDELAVAPLRPSAAPWPAGDNVGPARPDIEALLQDFVRQDNELGLNTRALLVVHNGAIVGEAYGQGANTNTPLLGWSMAKSLNSVMLGNLVYRGLLQLDEAALFPQWQDHARAAIRVADLLTMTDGLHFSEQYNPGDDATAMLFTVPSSSDYVMQMPSAYPPGTWFNYSSGTANLLSRLYTERLGGIQPAYDNYATTIREVLGFQHAVFETDASGVLMGSSYLYASARDWARLGQLMINGGEINGTRLVSSDWVAAASSPNQSENDPAYGYQFWLNRGREQLRWDLLPEDAYAAQGNRQQWVMIIPSRQAVIVRLGWTAGGYPANQRFAEILGQLN